jgi:BirA family biotin operon repressor/biotin-[acetyl-CoA-carboxylase] ligase
MKAEILKFLRSREGDIPGEAINSVLGISRADLAKHIRELRASGYRINDDPAGFRLLDSPDILFPWEYEGRVANILYYPEVTSTMDIARDQAREGCPDLTVVIAGRQTQGRGRLKRQWRSDQGGLYFTMVLRPQLPVSSGFKVNFLASLTMVRVIRELLEIDARVKWPNDIMVDDQKLSGMLSEMEAEADRIHYINLGMGLNVNNDPTGFQPEATSLRQLMKREVSRKDILARFLDTFSRRMQLIASDDIIAEWKKYTLTLGRRVKIATRHEQSEGLAVDVDDSGALVLKLANGQHKKIMYGDCFLI